MGLELIECEEMFKQSLKNGIMLFCGAGFSVEASDKKGCKLPVGAGLLEELREHFDSVKSYTDLPRACTKLERTEKEEFYSFLEERFEVDTFNPLYNELLKVRIKGIYTTNIDDLFYKLYDSSTTYSYLNNCGEKGKEFNDADAIPYFPLHGSVREKNKGYVFGVTEIASAFSENSKISAWNHLAEDTAKMPVLFWGWNFNDGGPLEAMYGKQKNVDENIYRWILLKENNEEMVDFFHSLKLNVIIGDTVGLLQYIKECNLLMTANDNIEQKVSEEVKNGLKRYQIPLNDEKMVSYRFEEYFIEYSPRWSHIYSHQIYKIEHYKNIVNVIASKKNVIVIGIRSSGKTTLMMQLMSDYDSTYMKHYMIGPTYEQAKNYLKHLKGFKSILFVDDCLRDTEALLLLLRSKNVQVIGFERDFNYEGQFHRLKNEKFELIEITEISLADAQGIIDSIPRSIKKENASTKLFEKDPTILNLLAGNLKSVNFNFINDFYKKDHISAEIFLMICYVHSCGVPCSFDMVYSYLGGDSYTWKEMIQIIERVGGLISECSNDFEAFELMAQFEDYYQCRSRILAENIINKIPRGDQHLKKVLQTFAKNVPIYKICSYDKFRRAGYDASLIAKVFTDVEEGEQFYIECAKKDNSEYLYQQAALYLSSYKEHKKAFEWVDNARNIAHYNRFTVDSTYAKIYFDVNLSASEEESLKALQILEKCCRNDKRKSIHFLVFAECVEQFCLQYPNSKYKVYLIETALEFISEGLSESNKALSKKIKWRLNDSKEKIKKL